MTDHRRESLRRSRGRSHVFPLRLTSRESVARNRRRRRRTLRFLGAAAVLLAAAGASASEARGIGGGASVRGDLAVVGGTVHPGNGAALTDAAVLIHGSRIAAVGARTEVEVDEGTPVIDATGLHITPGFIDLRSRLFLEESDLRDFGRAADRSAAEALTPFDPDWRAVRDEGVTTVAVDLGGSGNLGGLGAILKLRAPEPSKLATPLDRLLERESHYVFALGVTGTRSASARRLDQYYQVRAAFVAAREYGETWRKYWAAVEKYNKDLDAYLKAKKKASGRPAKAPSPGKAGKTPKPAETKEPGGAKRSEPSGKPEEPKAKEPEKREPKPKSPGRPGSSPKAPSPPRKPAVEPGREALLLALAGKLPVLVEAHRADDIEYARLLKEEFGLRLAVVGGTSARRHARKLAASGVPVALSPVLLRARALEYAGHAEENAAMLAKAAVPVAICSRIPPGTAGGDARRPNFSLNLAARNLRLHACAAVRGGLEPQRALRAITLEPARILGVDDRVGSLEKGKHADLVILDGDPLDARSRVVQVIVEGAPGKRRASRRARGWARAGGSERPATLGAVGALPVAEGAITALRRVNVLTPRADGAVFIEDAAVVLRGGRIAAIQPSGEALPATARVLELAGRWVLPGFIDAHSHIGLRGETYDASSAVTDELRVADAFDPWSEELRECLERGVTSVALSPGRSNVVGGVVSFVKLVPERVPLRVLRASEEPAGVALKTSLDPNVSLPRYPTSASGGMELLQRWIRERPVVRGGREVAQAEGAPVARGDSGAAPAPAGRAVSTGKPVPAAATGGVSGSLPVLVHVEWRNQAETVLRSFYAAGLRPVLVEGDLLEASTWRSLAGGAPVILRARDLGEGPRALASAAALEERGVPFAFSTSGPRRDLGASVASGSLRDLLTSAVLAIRHGLSQEEALRALTSSPAEIYGLEGRLGRVVEGADADLVVWSGDPFSLAARVEMVFVDGELVMDRREPDGVEVAGGSRPPNGRGRRGEGAAGGGAGGPASGVDSGEEASPSRFLIRADRLYTVSGAVIEGGQVVVADGVIREVGEEVSVDASAPGTRVIDVRGSLLPGFVDGGSSLGIRGRQADEFRELTPAHHVVDAVDFDHEAFRRASRAGVTTAAVTPGARNVVGGFGAAVKTAGISRRSRVLDREAFLCVSLTRESYYGNRSLRSSQPRSYYYRMPTTRMGTVFLARRAFFEAQSFPAAEVAPGPGPGTFEGVPSESGLKEMLEPRGRRVLAAVLSGELVARFRADTRAEILAALRIADEFGIRPHIEGCREGIGVVDELRARRAAVLLETDVRWGEEIRSNPELGARLPAELARAAVPFAFFSRSASEVPRLRERAMWCVRHGLDPRAALEAMTLGAARVLGIAGRVGSIEVGKDADLVAVGGEPFSASAPIIWVMVDGKIFPGLGEIGAPAGAAEGSRSSSRIKL